MNRKKKGICLGKMINEKRDALRDLKDRIAGIVEHLAILEIPESPFVTISKFSCY